MDVFDGRLHGLDLFSGIGGIALALRPWVRTVAYCEIERYATGVLLSRQLDGTLDPAPVWDDVATLTASQLQRAGIHRIDAIAGGFPCQDISVAGSGAGITGERSGLYAEIVRLVRELGPKLVFLENVPAITSRGLGAVLGDLAEVGYDARWGCIRASDVGAPHRRDRWWLLAYSHRTGLQGRDNPARVRNVRHRSGGDSPAASSDATCVRCERRGGARRWRDGFENHDWRLTEPPIRGADDGVPDRPHRIRSLGNAVVPLQARAAFERLVGLVDPWREVDVEPQSEGNDDGTAL